MTTHDLAARIQRLDQLARGLVQETMLIEQADDPMRYTERWAYPMAILDAIGSIESARVTLVKAQQRLEDNRR